MEGIINVYKEEDFTSHDVVAKLRGILKTKKIGHTGTLDPKATGVLPVCVGRATKLCDYLVCEKKEYQAELTFGLKSDTEDIWGAVAAGDDCAKSTEEINAAIMSFIGKYSQIPPMYSAKKINGKKLYELARAGKTVERKPVEVEIFDIKVTYITPSKAGFLVSCSKGTYIRTLCTDIGKKLNCDAVMSELKRTKSGQFTIEAAYTLNQIEELALSGKLEENMLSVETVFSEYPSLYCNEKGEKALYNGNRLSADMFAGFSCEPQKHMLYRIYDTKNRFQAIYKFDREEEAFLPEKMFLEKT